MKTLYAVREIIHLKGCSSLNKTELFNEHGKLVSTYSVDAHQPRYGKKKITHNCFNYLLVWGYIPKPKQ